MKMIQAGIKKIFTNFSFINVLLLILGILLFPKVISFFQYIFAVLNYPYVWALTENENMLFIQRLISLQPLYKMHDVDTFLYVVYPPMFHFISAFFIKLFGFTLLIPRLISLISFAALIFVLLSFFKEKGKIFENLLVTFLLFTISIALSPYSSYFILARVDMLGFAFAFASIYFLWQIVYQNRQERKYYLLAGILAILALFTKQSILFPYFIIFLCFFLVKNKKQFFSFGVWLSTISVFTLFLINVITQGEFIKSMLLASEIYSKYLNSSTYLELQQRIFSQHYFGLFLGAIFLSALSFYRILVLRKTPFFSSIVFFAIYINFLMTGGNTGAGANTLLPLLFGALLVMKELYFIKSIPSYEAFSKVVFFALIILQMMTFNKLSQPYVVPTVSDKENQTLLINELKKSSTEWVLGDRIDYAIITAGKKSPLEASTHNVATEWKETKKDAFAIEDDLLKRIKDKEINMVVLTITNFGEGDLISYIRSKGTPVKTITINYMDAVKLDHKIYKFNEK